MPGPRDSPRHRERGPAVLIRVTWQEIADLLGVSIHTARKLGGGAGRRFNPRSLVSVVAYYLGRKVKRGKSSP